MCLVRVVRGGNGLTDGPAKPENLERVMKKVAELGFAHKPQVGNSFFYLFSSNFVGSKNF